MATVKLQPKPVTAVAESSNRKTGKVSATYVSQASCPSTGIDRCALLGDGCYAETGHTAFTTRRLNRSTDTDTTAIARMEAEAIRALPGTLPLRVHVVGDCATNPAAKLVGAAMDAYPQPSWTYTHAWRTVDRASWGNASVLASCETPAEVRQANARGYAAAIVVAEKHPSPKVYDRDDIKILPCPGEMNPDSVTCASCMLCTKDTMLKERGLTIGFYVHGSGKDKAAAAIQEKIKAAAAAIA